MAKNRSKTKELPFDIDSDYVYSLWKQQEGTCLLSGVPFELTSNVGVVPHAPSLDRIIPELGYVRGNVRLITYHLNISISEFGQEGFEQLIKNYVSYNKLIG